MAGGSRKLPADGWDQSLAGDEGGEGGAPVQECLGSIQIFFISIVFLFLFLFLFLFFFVFVFVFVFV